MSGYFVLMALLLTGPLPDNKAKADLEKRNTVEVICGKLILVEPVLFNGAPVGGQFERTPIKNAKLRLYYRDKHTRCCKKQSLAAEAVTGKDGYFDFTSVDPGSYWLVGRRDGAQYSLAINYDLMAHTDDKCSKISYELRDGELRLAKMRVYTMYENARAN
jgi:Prealbumin-like fold domain